MTYICIQKPVFVAGKSIRIMLWPVMYSVLVNVLKIEDLT